MFSGIIDSIIKGLFSEYPSIKKPVASLIPTNLKHNNIGYNTTLLSDTTMFDVFNCGSATVKISL